VTADYVRVTEPADLFAKARELSVRTMILDVVIASRPFTAAPAVVTNAAKSSGTSSTHEWATSRMISNASKQEASISGRVDAPWMRAWMDGAGCSGCGMTGQPDVFRDLA
jgi:hypothetical protein